VHSTRTKLAWHKDNLSRYPPAMAGQGLSSTVQPVLNFRGNGGAERFGYPLANFRKSAVTNALLERGEPLLSLDDLSYWTSVPKSTLYSLLSSGRGPCHARIGRSLRFFRLRAGAATSAHIANSNGFGSDSSGMVSTWRAVSCLGRQSLSANRRTGYARTVAPSLRINALPRSMLRDR
jgi:hypothetical protein